MIKFRIVMKIVWLIGILLLLMGCVIEKDKFKYLWWVGDIEVDFEIDGEVF